MVENQAVQFSCLAVGEPQPSVQWFRNDVLLLPDHRMSISYNAATGVSILKLDPAHLYDCGVYKAVARNLCYSLVQKEASANDWTDLAENIDHEFFLVRNLVANTDYQFRLAARNKFGWSDKSIPTQPVPTKDVGSPRVSVTRAMKYLQQLTESGQQLFLSDAGQADSASTASTDYTVETDPKHVKCTPPTDDLSFIAEINRGRFSLIAKCAGQNRQERRQESGRDGGHHHLAGQSRQYSSCGI